ncbi:MAG: phenylalanine--tRNA ligase subunit beta [Deltaproteobacteria bacterium]|jgi:phenylalanyl-tRNA synthetase beta chain|nr:phenylalanine--tRNA ligase subunit beta [Deltaproteobacteria bacterium]
MLASLSWLGEFVDLDDLSPSDVCDRLSMAGLECESLYDFKAYLEQVRAVRLLEAEPQGTLARCVLDLGGGERAQVLCGAPNLEVDKIYPFVPMGTLLPEGAVKKMTFKGVESFGMLASAFELLVGEDDQGVLELDPSTPVGTSLKSLYPEKDWILEIGVTPNRGDALSHLGIARDLAAILGRGFKEPSYSLEGEGRPAAMQARVTIECPEACFRYCARVVNGATPKRSPLWLASRLNSLGARSISDVVDVTNYVMLELGLPLHAFDLDLLAGSEIIVRTYGAGTRFTTLDGQERVFSGEGNILICDRDKPVGIGGIMGGLNSEVTKSTRNVLVEAAMFNPVNIRRSSKSLGLSTDASFRFERGQDQEGCPRAASRAANLIASLSGGKAAPGLLDSHPRPFKAREIPFSPERCNRVLGTSHPASGMRRVLNAAGVTLKEEGGGLFTAFTPSFRLDILREADLFEEVLRLLDFEKLPATSPPPPAPAGAPPWGYLARERLRSFMVAQGFLELVSYSFHHRDRLDKLELPKDDPLRLGTVPILNPLSEETGVLRASLVPCLLNAARLNQRHNQWDLPLFELGAVFLSPEGGGKPLERQSFGALLASSPDGLNWAEEKRPVDFYDLKGVLEELARTFGEVWTFEGGGARVPAFLDRREAAAVFRGGLFLGYLGLLKKSCAKNFGLKEYGGPVYLCEIFPEDLPPRTVPTFQPFSTYPGITRDLSVLVDEGATAALLERAVRESGDFPLLSVVVFDRYEGDKLPPGKKSLGFRLFFQDMERTLNEELAAGWLREITAALEREFGAKLRD